MPEQEGNAAATAIGSEAGGNNGNGVTDGGANNGAQAGNNLGWRAGLPSDLREHQAFTDKGTVGDLGRAFLSAQEQLSRAVVMPGDNASETEVKEFRSKLGVPDAPDKYSFSASSDDAEFDSMFQKLAHTQGLNPQQADAMHKELIEASKAMVSTQQKQAKEAREAATDKLRQEWGSQYQSNDAAARRFAALAGSDLTDALVQSGLMDDPRVIKGLHRFATMISEDHMVSGRGQQNTGSSGWAFPNTPGM